ncbi:restriction endonuclease subunit S [Roseateles puraquae]|uniref:restriction endonuclease subunit S n=1 Tax=Roseateles puraquae TaxID=431059 RepID=UPI0018749C2D|nr:restriction endonuclease subunit S [Roseateles puraquae]
MTALLTKKFGHIAAAPNEISMLRELILKLAVQGRLTGPESRANSAGHLQSGWRFLKLPDAATYRIGKTPPSKEARHWDAAGIPWVSISDMTHFETVTDTARKVSKDFAGETFKYEPVPAGSLLMSFKLTVGKVAILGVAGYHNEAIISMQPKDGLSRDYLMRVLPAIAQAGRTKDALMGATLNSSSLAELVVPVPSLEEQHRIVAKVDELMALCDRLEAEQADAEAAHAKLVEALLASLTQARDAAEFRASWQQLAEHFHTVFTTEASVDALRAAILCLAAEGKLVREDVNVQQLPIGQLLLGDSLNGCSRKPSDDPGGTPILRISAGTGSDDFYVDEADHKWVDASSVERDKFRLLPNDLLACRFNGNLKYVGSFSLYRGTSGAEQIFPDKLIRFRVDPSRVLADYVRFVMNAAPARKQIEAFCATTVGNIGISATNLKTVELRVPSLNEQHRIVARVTQLFSLCDQLKASLVQACTHHEQLASVLVDRAVA